MVAVTEDKVQLWLQKGWLIQEKELKILEKLVSEHPYYKEGQILLARAYKNTKNIGFEKQLHKAALCTKDREWLYEFIHQKAQNVTEKEKVEKVSVVSEVQQDEVKEKVNSKLGLQKQGIDLEDNVPKIEEKENETALKIDIKQGEGKVQKVEEEENLKAIEPKLKVEEVMKENVLDKEVLKTADEAEKPKPKKQAKNSQNNLRKNNSIDKELSFLDWLDFSQGAEKDNINDQDKEVLSSQTAHSNISQTEEMLSKFLANKPKPGEVKFNNYDPEEKSMESDSAEYIPVSETLARVYVEQSEFDMARKVYEKLILKFPQKKAYFAALIQDLDN